MSKTRVIVSWSSGKDSALVFYKLLQSSDYGVVGLLTTVTKDYHRVAMHGVREELLELQAERLNLPLYKVIIPKNCSDQAYQDEMAETIAKLEKQNVSRVAFGDIFLEDIKKYREKQLAEITITPLFPLWKQDSKQLAAEFIELGFKAVVTCVDTTKMSNDFIGCEYNGDFVSKLPANIDPCGENGEFHTFVYDGPIFKEPINIKKGIVVQRDGFLFNDILVE